MKELVVISGKGGTGKTSITASFAVLADRPVVADYDVDAADMHLLLKPETVERHDFYAGRLARINTAQCTACGLCRTYCRFDAVITENGYRGNTVYRIDPSACDGCGVCVRFCPAVAIVFPDRLCGEWMRSETNRGPLVHAKLFPAAENSGKLVALVRKEARRIAEEENRKIIITDGPPGIGCPVISSITGASMVLVVTEPTVSGEHDLGRVLSLVRHFSLPAAVCVNKWDLNPEMTERIETAAKDAGVRIAGRVRYDPMITAAQMNEKAVVETDAPSADEIRRIWEELDPEKD